MTVRPCGSSCFGNEHFAVEVHMSTDKTNERSDEMRDPTEDKYLELEKRLWAAEYALAADIAADNKTSDDAMETAREHTRSAIGDIRRRLGDGRG
jgi:hypothetical protein